MMGELLSCGLQNSRRKTCVRAPQGGVKISKSASPKTARLPEKNPPQVFRAKAIVLKEKMLQDAAAL